MVDKEVLTFMRVAPKFDHSGKSLEWYFLVVLLTTLLISPCTCCRYTGSVQPQTDIVTCCTVINHNINYSLNSLVLKYIVVLT